jgi:ABC-2 type transport system permease protein
VPAPAATPAPAAATTPAAAPGAATTSRTATPGLSLPYTTREQEVTAESGRSYNAYAHSFAGMGVQFILLLGVDLGMGLLLARRMGIWQRLRAAPLARRTLLGSCIASGTVIALLVLAGVYAAAIAFFGVRIQGSVVGFVGVGLAFALMTSCIGLLISSIGRTPEVTRGLAIVLTLLLVMLGGAWVPTFIFPPWLQTLTQFVPTRWAIDGLDATTWRGLGLEAVLPQIGAMLGCSALFGALAIRLFRWQE